MRLRATVGAVAIAFASPAPAPGQTVEVPRPRTLLVGTPAGGARTDRVDGARTGRARTELPSSGLHTEWRTPLGTRIEHAPLVDERANTYVVGAAGDVIALGRDGAEQWRVATGAAQPGPAAILTDGTIVFADAAGNAVGVRDAAVRWRVRFGQPGAVAHPAPLPLDDGGVVIATTHELAALDAEGRERARTPLPEPTAVPLLAARGQVIVVTTSGAVWSWAPGAAEPTRVASFDSPVEGGAALADDHTLVAVTAGEVHLAAVDLSRATTTTRAAAPGGLLLGPPTVHHGTTYLTLMTSTGELAIAIDALGVERFRTLLSSHPPSIATDGGISKPVVGPHTPPLTDNRGDFVFATADGSIGATRDGGGGAATVELLGEKCEPPVGAASRLTPPVAGLAPLDEGAFVAACHAGAIIAIRGRTR